jgi:hypothetical protein
LVKNKLRKSAAGDTRESAQSSMNAYLIADCQLLVQPLQLLLQISDEIRCPAAMGAAAGLQLEWRSRSNTLHLIILIAFSMSIRLGGLA